MLFPARFAPLVFVVLMSIYMVTLMTFVITRVNRPGRRVHRPLVVRPLHRLAALLIGHSRGRG